MDSKQRQHYAEIYCCEQSIQRRDAHLGKYHRAEGLAEFRCTFHQGPGKRVVVINRIDLSERDKRSKHHSYQDMNCNHSRFPTYYLDLFRMNFQPLDEPFTNSLGIAGQVSFQPRRQRLPVFVDNLGHFLHESRDIVRLTMEKSDTSPDH